jgi:hypothetical protein
MFVDAECLTPHNFIAVQIPDRAVGAVPIGLYLAIGAHSCTAQGIAPLGQRRGLTRLFSTNIVPLWGHGPIDRIHQCAYE